MATEFSACTLSEFAQIISNEIPRRNTGSNSVIWRGHAKSEWALEPSVVRRIQKSKGGNVTDSLEERVQAYETHLIRSARSRGLDYADGRKLTELQLLARIRHFGGATRLVDFTRNPITALWFACQECPTEEGTVYALDTLGSIALHNTGVANETIHELVTPEKYQNVLYFWRPKYFSDRMHAQQAVLVFSYLNRESDGSDWSSLQVNSPSTEAGSQQIYTIRIDRKLKEKMNDKWSKIFGYNQLTMYPDIEGFGAGHDTEEPIDGADFFL